MHHIVIAIAIILIAIVSQRITKPLSLIIHARSIISNRHEGDLEPTRQLLSRLETFIIYWSTFASTPRPNLLCISC